jgi:transposase-like protein
LSIVKRRRFPVEIILLCVRSYCKYGISYRDLAEMMQERGGLASERWRALL